MLLSEIHTDCSELFAYRLLFSPWLWRRRRCGLSCEPLGFQTLPVLRKCLLGDLVLTHCRFDFYLAERLARFPLGIGDFLGRLDFARVSSSFLCLWPIIARLSELFRPPQQQLLTASLRAFGHRPNSSARHFGQLRCFVF